MGADHDFRPFVRWVGGKRRVTRQLRAIADGLWDANGTYFEPFLGGGALLLNIQAKSKIGGDLNGELINSYNVIRDSPVPLLRILNGFESSINNYQKLVKEMPKSPVRRAARFIFLNRHSFGGIYRVNKKGEYNVPYGGPRGYERVRNREYLIGISNLIKNVQFKCLDFQVTLASASSGDLIFCDPVYKLDSETRVFDRYTETVFSWSDLERLIQLLRLKKAIGVRSILILPESDSVCKLLEIAPLARLQRIGAFGKISKTYDELVFVF